MTPLWMEKSFLFVKSDLNKLKNWTSTYCIKFSKGKCQILHLEQDNPGYTLETSGWEAALWKGIWWFWLMAS